METESDAIKHVLERYGAMCNTGDFEAWISLWSAEGRQMPPDAPARIGIDAIRDGMKPVFDTMDLDFVLVGIEEVRVFGDLGLTRCNYTLGATPKEGGTRIEVMPDGKALTLYQKQSDGSWKIVYDCFNSNTG